VNVRFQNIKITFEFQGHGVNIKVKKTKKRPRAGMCSPRRQFSINVLFSKKNTEISTFLQPSAQFYAIDANIFICIDIKNVQIKIKKTLKTLPNFKKNVCKRNKNVISSYGVTSHNASNIVSK